MKYAMDVKVNLKPIFSNLVHTDWWEGPCRVKSRLLCKMLYNVFTISTYQN